MISRDEKEGTARVEYEGTEYLVDLKAVPAEK